MAAAFPSSIKDFGTDPEDGDLILPETTIAEHEEIVAIETRLLANTFPIGDGAAGNKVIQANNGDANPASVRFNDTSNKWEISNDGTTWAEVVRITNVNISPTTANQTAAANRRYFADISGLTANRNFVLPAGVVGDTIELNIKAGDDTYALVVIGNTGITINGGAEATEWSRLFISGEFIKLVADSTSNWQVVSDGRIPCRVKITNTAAQSIGNGAVCVVVLNAVTRDNCFCADIANSHIGIRRAGDYLIAGFLRLEALAVGAASRFAVWIDNDSGNHLQFVEQSPAVGCYPASAMVLLAENMTVNSWVRLSVFQNSGGDVNTIATDSPHLEIVEQIP